MLSLLTRLVFVSVFGNEEDDRLRERIRRNSDSVVYVKPKENEVTVVLSKLKQAEIKFQQEKIDRLEKEISKISEANTGEEFPLSRDALAKFGRGLSAGKDNFFYSSVNS